MFDQYKHAGDQPARFQATAVCCVVGLDTARDDSLSLRGSSRGYGKFSFETVCRVVHMYVRCTCGR